MTKRRDSPDVPIAEPGDVFAEVYARITGRAVQAAAWDRHEPDLARTVAPRRASFDPRKSPAYCRRCGGPLTFDRAAAAFIECACFLMTPPVAGI